MKYTLVAFYLLKQYKRSHLVCISGLLPNVNEVSPIDLQRLASELMSYPDKQKAAFVLHGIANGFDIEIEPKESKSQIKCDELTNTLSPNIVDLYLQTELTLKRIAGPYKSYCASEVNISSFDLIPEPSQPDKLHLVMDMKNLSIKSKEKGILESDCENYVKDFGKFDKILSMVCQYGCGALMSKLDMKDLYHEIPVMPAQRLLLAVKWKGLLYVILTLPYGLPSTVNIVNSVVDIIEWILVNNYSIHDLVFLENLITVGPPLSTHCQHRLTLASSFCKQLGLTIRGAKNAAQETRLSVLGVEVDSVRQIATMPTDQLAELKRALNDARGRRIIEVSELESLISLLRIASCLVPAGRGFFFRLTNVLRGFNSRNHPVRLNGELRKDVKWWDALVQPWKGVTTFLLPGVHPIAEFHVTLHSSDALGYGAMYETEWFNERWESHDDELPVACKNLLPLVLAVHLWGQKWAQQRVCFHFNSLAIVKVLNAQFSEEPSVMHLLRFLLLTAAKYNLTFEAKHLPGMPSAITEALSNVDWQRLRVLAPHASSVVVPPEIIRDFTDFE